MDLWTMIVLVTLVGCLAGVADTYLKNRKAERSSDLSDDALAELNELRQRVEVLEKIVTDEKYQLSRELNELERRA